MRVSSRWACYSRSDGSGAPRVTTSISSVRAKLFLGIGQFAVGIVSFASLGVLALYARLDGFSAAQGGIAVFAVALIDTLAAWAAGRISDRTPAKWGRRLPYFYAAAPLAGLFYLLLWSPPDGATFWYLLTVLGALRIFTTIYDTTSAALVPQAVRDANARAGVFGARAFSAALGMFVVSSLTFAYFTQPDADHPP